jgi:hypothetical protein
MPDAPATREEIEAGLRMLDDLFGITSSLWGNGCRHGFKPAKNCTNADCEERLAHIAWENAIERRAHRENRDGE